MAVTSVIFDIGNVLYDWDIAALYAQLIADPAERAWFCRTVVTPEWHFQHDAGRPFADTSAELIARFPAYAEQIRAFGPRFKETIVGEVPGMADIVQALAARAVPMFAITNFSAEFWPAFRATARLIDPVRDVVVSGAVGLVKPDPAIYALACRRFGVAPAQALFIDDRADNVAAARAFGMAAHQFRDAATLAPVLAAHGLIG